MKTLLLLTLIVALAYSLHLFSRNKTFHWLVYYGPTLSEKQLSSIQLAIVEPDHIQANDFSKSKTQWIAYLSVGEIHHSRPYWPMIQNKSYVIEENENWKGSFRLDLRSSEWQEKILNEIIPDLVQKGYQGVFLDTIDTGLYLESKDSQKFKGSREATVQLVKKIKSKFPSLAIYPNNALELLQDYGNEISGVVVEDLYTRYDFKNNKSIQTPSIDSEYKEKFLDEFKKRFNKKVLNILYADSPKSPLGKYAIERSIQKGYNWFLTNIELTQIGESG